MDCVEKQKINLKVIENFLVWVLIWVLIWVGGKADALNLWYEEKCRDGKLESYSYPSPIL